MHTLLSSVNREISDLNRCCSHLRVGPDFAELLVRSSLAPPSPELPSRAACRTGLRGRCCGAPLVHGSMDLPPRPPSSCAACRTRWVLKMSNERISLLSQYRGGTGDGQLVHTGIVVLDQEGTHMYGQIPADSSGTAVPILASFPTGLATLVVLPLDEMNTPISAFKGKGQAIMPKTPSKSPCPKSSRRKLFTEPSKPKDTELSASAAKVASQAEQGAPAGNVIEATSVPNVHAFVLYLNNFPLLHKPCFICSNI